MHLVRDVLDNRLTDRRGRPLGRADGLVLLIRPGHQPQITHIETGLPTLAARLSPRLGRLVRAIGSRLGLRRGIPTRLPWSAVRKVDLDIRLDVDAERTGALAYEDWLREHVTRHIPGNH